MAILQVGLAAGDFQFLPNLLDATSVGAVTTTSPTTFAYTSSDGHTVTVTGAGFTYNAGIPQSGTIASLVVKTAGDEMLFQVTQFSSGLALFYSDIFGQDGSGFRALNRVLAGDDQLLGSEESDHLGGYSPGNDTMEGKGGDDYISGDKGNDKLDGGTGFNSLGYTQTYFDDEAFRGIKLDAAKGTVKDPWGDSDQISNFDSFQGSKFKDVMKGSKKDFEEFHGLGGNDKIDGKGGFDQVSYSEDLRYGGKKGIKADLAKGQIKDGFGDTDSVKNIEGVRGTAKKDVFIGTEKSEEFEGIGGKDKFIGGGGGDRISFNANDFSGGLNGARVDLAKRKVLDDGYGNKETLKGFAWVGGSNQDDVFLGDGRENWLSGRDGDDVLNGRGGNDHLDGDRGNDTLTGGKGSDDFNFRHYGDENADLITDFSGKKDNIWLDSSFGFGASGKGLQETAFLAAAGATQATTAAHRVIYNTTNGNLYIDADGVGGNDSELVATLKDAPQLNAFNIWFL